MTLSLHGPYELGYTRATMEISKSCKNVSWSKSFKCFRSSDYFLQFENMKLESLVIVNQHVTVNMFSSSVHTARHALGAGNI
jgi:hypothetical protein